MYLHISYCNLNDFMLVFGCYVIHLFPRPIWILLYLNLFGCYLECYSPIVWPSHCVEIMFKPCYVQCYSSIVIITLCGNYVQTHTTHAILIITHDASLFFMKKIEIHSIGFNVITHAAIVITTQFYNMYNHLQISITHLKELWQSWLNKGPPAAAPEQ